MKAYEKNSNYYMCTMSMRRVVARSSGIGSISRACMKLPSEVEKTRKPAKPTVSAQLGLTAFLLPLQLPLLQQQLREEHLRLQPQSQPLSLLRVWVLQVRSLLELMSQV